MCRLREGMSPSTTLLKVTLGRRAQPTASQLAEQNQRLCLTREFSAHSCLTQQLKRRSHMGPIPFFHPAKAGKLIHGPVYTVEYTAPATRNTDQEGPILQRHSSREPSQQSWSAASASTHWPSQASGQTVASPQRDRTGPRLPGK